jgi:hypothetical protein
MNYTYGYLVLGAFSCLVLIALMRSDAKHYPPDKIYPKCPPEEHHRHNYLTYGGVCQECAWKDIGERMKDSYN